MIWVLITSMCFIGFLCNKIVRLRRLLTTNIQQRLENTLVDLDLATFDQLVEELRKRSESAILLQLENQLLRTEIYNLSENQAMRLLRFAGVMASQKLREVQSFDEDN